MRSLELLLNSREFQPCLPSLAPADRPWLCPYPIQAEEPLKHRIHLLHG